jgi:hypothetical protein
MQKGYEDSTPWQLSSVQLQGDVLTVSLADVGVVGPAGGACQHALGVKANVVAEARICVYEFTAGDSAERMVNSILDRCRSESACQCEQDREISPAARLDFLCSARPAPPSTLVRIGGHR